MMKHLKHILLVALALAFLTTSCIDPLEPMPKGLDARLPDKALVFSPSILGSTVVTKAINTGDNTLGELAIETLDVYVYKILSGSDETAVTEFFKRYHFLTVIPEGETVETLAAKNVFVKTSAELASGEDIVLETDWRQAGYDQTGNQKYRIYSIANSRMAGLDRWVNMSESTLKAKTITSAQTHSGSYDIVRPKDGEGPGSDYFNIHIKDKNFLMDGMIDEWAITVSESQQYFTLKQDKSFPLTRAAAKFIVNLSFDPAFLEQLEEEETIISTNPPRFKFANFMPVTFEVAPVSTSASWRDNNIWSSRYNYDFPEHTPTGELDHDPSSDHYVGKVSYSLTTYSYSFAWENSTVGAICAPALVLIVNYTKTGSQEETFYYRVPLVDLTNITSIDRNYLYLVDATISSKGAIIEDIEPTNVVLKYQVLPWAFNAATDVTEVEGAELLYFTADTTFTLRGEQTQSVPLDYFTPKSELMSGHYLYEPKISNVRTYYVVSAGDTTNIVARGSGTYSNANRSWVGTNSSVNGSRVTVNVLPSIENDGGGGVVSVSSDVLANRAVKHIEFDASVTFTVTDPNTSVSTTTTVTHHYHILHFPLDNIQSVEGLWSSRWNGEYGGSISTWYRKKFYRTTGEREEISQEEWVAAIGSSNAERIRYNSWENRNSSGYYATGQSATTTQTNTGSNVPRSDNPTITWSGRNSVSLSYNGRTTTINMPLGNVYYDYVSNFDYEYSFWTGWVRTGTTTLVKYEQYWHDTSRTEDTYDPVAAGWESYERWEWEVCTQDQYEATAEENRKVETATVEPSTGNWVIYNGGGNNYTYRDNNYGGDYGYYAKVVYNNSIYRLNASGTRGSSAQVAGNNVHMYVIQISKAENGVSLGRPRLNNNQSNDNVVSPAFMIASQLGAVRSASFSNAPQRAADHCATYMEVAANNRRFVNWRLPTKAEIAYIASYQNNQNIQGQGIFTYVLTGNYYYTLDGGNAPSNLPPTAPDYDASDNTVYVRCIRDLTPAEVEELNKKGFITEATY